MRPDFQGAHEPLSQGPEQNSVTQFRYRAARFRLPLEAIIEAPGATWTVSLLDLSQDGAGMLPHPAMPGTFLLKLPAVNGVLVSPIRCQVLRRSGDSYGVCFAFSSPQQQLELNHYLDQVSTLCRQDDTHPKPANGCVTSTVLPASHQSDF